MWKRYIIIEYNNKTSLSVFNDRCLLLPEYSASDAVAELLEELLDQRHLRRVHQLALVRDLLRKKRNVRVLWHLHWNPANGCVRMIKKMMSTSSLPASPRCVRWCLMRCRQLQPRRRSWWRERSLRGRCPGLRCGCYGAALGSLGVGVEMVLNLYFYNFQNFFLFLKIYCKCTPNFPQQPFSVFNMEEIKSLMRRKDEIEKEIDSLNNYLSDPKGIQIRKLQQFTIIAKLIPIPIPNQYQCNSYSLSLSIYFLWWFFACALVPLPVAQWALPSWTQTATPLRATTPSQPSSRHDTRSHVDTPHTTLSFLPTDSHLLFLFLSSSLSQSRRLDQWPQKLDAENRRVFGRSSFTH